MVRLADLPADEARFLREWPCPKFDDTPLLPGPPLARRRVVMISTAGLRRRRDRPFGVDAGDYRLLPLAERHELVQDHASATHDRTGFHQDLNTIFPLDRLLELRDAGVIGSVADPHYSFMGAGDQARMQTAARDLARILRADAVDTAVLCPV